MKINDQNSFSSLTVTILSVKQQKLGIFSLAKKIMAYDAASSIKTKLNSVLEQDDWSWLPPIAEDIDSDSEKNDKSDYTNLSEKNLQTN